MPAPSSQHDGGSRAAGAGSSPSRSKSTVRPGAPRGFVVSSTRGRLTTEDHRHRPGGRCAAQDGPLHRPGQRHPGHPDRWFRIAVRDGNTQAGEASARSKRQAESVNVAVVPDPTRPLASGGAGRPLPATGAAVSPPAPGLATAGPAAADGAAAERPATAGSRGAAGPSTAAGLCPRPVRARPPKHRIWQACSGLATIRTCSRSARPRSTPNGWTAWVVPAPGRAFWFVERLATGNPGDVRRSSPRPWAISPVPRAWRRLRVMPGCPERVSTRRFQETAIRPWVRFSG